MEKTKPFMPCADRVFIRLPKPKDKTPGGIALPDTARQQAVVSAEVLYVGPGLVLQNGQHLQPEVRAGDVVLVNDHSGFEVEVNGEKLRCIKLGEVIAVSR